jgi:hypothetical protein
MLTRARKHTHTHTCKLDVAEGYGLPEGSIRFAITSSVHASSALVFQVELTHY